MQPESFTTIYEQALASQDWAQVAPLIAEKACVTFSDGSVHSGKAAIQAAFERNFSLIKSEAYKVSDVRWLHQGAETAVYTFSFSWKGIINGQLASGQGVGSSVLLWENDRWVLLVEHLGKK